MIPVKLSMRNFMCYRDNVPPLHFDGIHLACLSGDNGNGKSAIIDAVTWALWGKTRAGSDDDLIHTAQSEMEVEFDFTVGQQLYRILRKRSRPRRRGGAGQSILEFQVSTGNGFRPITGNTISQTQQKIIDILHMDYDTFVNSAYLRQGRADEFTRQAPAKRKEVLGNILGLSQYDELEEQAKRISKQNEVEKSQLESNIQDINDELARKSAYEDELEEAQSLLSRIEVIAQEKENALNELKNKKEALESKKAQLDDLETRISNSVRDLERWDEQAGQLYTRIKEHEEVIGQRDAIEEGYARFASVKKSCEELNLKSQQFYKLEKQKEQLERRITEAGHSLNTEHAVTKREISNLEARVQKLPELKNQLNQVQIQVRSFAEPEAALHRRERAIQELQTQVNYLESENIRFEREISEITEKLDLLSSQTEAKCPLCETELTREGLERIAANYTADKQRKTGLIQTTRAELALKRTELESSQEEKVKHESELSQEKTQVQSQASILTKEIAETEETEKQLAELRKKLDGIEQRLARRDFAATEQEALIAITTELTSLGYDAEKHERERRQLSQLETYDHDKHRLEEAERLIYQEREAASRAEEATLGLRHSMELDKQKVETLKIELVNLPRLVDDLAKAEAEYRELAGQRSRHQEAVGSVKARLQRCAELESRKKEKASELTQATREENIYKELAQAFGKGGIQALLIETALPEIESEANRLLGRMTDNRMHVKFEPQRETKKGSIRETLDINIADELGTRNYEMFSGGEAFRINFAIRIALSRLLARRAGAPLPTLIIDEGFGTQDSTGMEKLKEAINSIQDDFNKILVITHMDELRDAFPTRIDVVKTAAGSTISIN
jgi:exonuclease SbcC